MATIKNCTDLPQSKKLTEILPIESADMCHKCIGDEPYDVIIRPYSEYYEKYKSLIISKDFNAIPCWSLAALLGLIPKEINVLGTIYSINIQTRNEKWFIDYKCNNEEFIGAYSNIFVDACYEMIIKLKEQKLL